MAYALTLLAILAVFLWTTPAHIAVSERFQPAARMGRAVLHDGVALVSRFAQEAASTVREKAMELLRQELHRSVEELVR